MTRQMRTKAHVHRNLPDRALPYPALVAGLLVIAAVAALPRAAADDRFTENDKALYAVATAHLDTQWLWTIQDTINSYIPNTLATNFARIDQSPNYTFSFEGAFRYALMKEYYPADYARLKQYVAAGRWRVAGSAVDAGDVNIASPEALIRQTLLGNGYFDREFGKRSRDIFLPDCFGFGYALPTIAAHCGLLGFSTQKLGWGSAVDVPFSIGRWEGPDGRQIVAALRPGGYTEAIREDLSHSRDWLAAVDGLGKRCGVYAGYMYFGVGDTGGGPDAETVQWLDKSIAGTGPLHVVSAGSDQLYRDLTPQQTAMLPAYKGELLLTTHGTGCYTSQAAMKRWNRANELLGDSAERAAVAASWLGGAAYPTAKLDDAWSRFLWHQFHDDLTGTSIPEAYAFSWNDEILSLNQFAEVLADSVGAVTRALDTRAAGQALVVYNPLSVARQDVAEARVAFPKKPANLRVYGSDGAEVASQVLSWDGATAHIVFLARVPSVGFAVYDVRPSSAPCRLATGLIADVNTGATALGKLENRRYRVTVDGNGDVASIFDKALGKELLSAPLRLEMLKDTSRQWPAWEVLYQDVTAEPSGFAGPPQKARVVESGPARVALELVRYAGQSTVVQRLELAAGDAGDQLVFDTRIAWQSKATMLKATFPLAAANPKATYDLGIGSLQRGTDTRRLYEVPAQQWADLTDAGGGDGVAILNDCKYGWDHPADNTLRLTLVRTPRDGGGFNNQATNDLGRHQMRYALCAHRGDWRKGDVVWQAARLNQPLIAFHSPAHTGRLGKSFSLLRVSDPRVAVRALKGADGSEEVVLRLQETSGEAVAKVTIALAAPIVSAREVNGAEEPLGPLSPVGGKLTLSLTPYQPRTVAVKLGAAPMRLSPPESAPLALPFNRDVVGLGGEKSGGDADGQGRCIPGELWPKAVTTEGIIFRLGPKDPGAMNAVACRGQVLRLPEGKGDRLYLLAAAAGDDRAATFSVGAGNVRATVPSWTGFVGQWDSRLVGGKTVRAFRELAPAYIKRVPVAWVGTHRHTKDGANEAYVFCYLFKIALPLARGAKTLRLPDDPGVLVMAATLASDRNADTSPASDLYDRPVRMEELPPAAPAAAGPPLKAVNPADLAPGLRLSYYEGDFSSVSDLAGAQPAGTSIADAIAIPDIARPQSFGLKFEGYIEVPRDGVYTFYTSSDDGSVLKIGDTTVVDNDGLHSQGEEVGEIALAAGKHPITVLYFQGPGDRALEVTWEGPGFGRGAIPAAALTHGE